MKIVILILGLMILGGGAFAQFVPTSQQNKMCIKSLTNPLAADCFVLVNAIDKDGKPVQVRQGIQSLTTTQIDNFLYNADIQKEAWTSLREKVVEALK